VPAAKIAPRDATAASTLPHWDSYGPETPGAPEAVFFLDPRADDEGRTQATLRNAAGTQGVTVRFNKQQLPYFTLWKNRQSLRDGYVTGLEPGINFPNPKPFEQQRGRVVSLAPGESRRFEIVIEAHGDAAALGAAEQQVAALQADAPPVVLDKPDPDWSIV
jgi:galactose mutarotase-like enzyme